MFAQNLELFGNCVMCHKHLLHNRVVNNKVEPCWDAQKDDAYMKLTNGSILVVSMCKSCKESLNLDDPEVQKDVMLHVHHGWKLEAEYMEKNPEKFPEWTPEKKESLQKFYNDLKIHHQHKGELK